MKTNETLQTEIKCLLYCILFKSNQTESILKHEKKTPSNKNWEAKHKA